MADDQLATAKPLLRGHFHQAAFFLTLGACAMLVAKSSDRRTLIAAVIYSFSLTTLFGVSGLYHRRQWNESMRMWMRRLDHSSIFILIAGTSTPICRLALPEAPGLQMLKLVWSAATAGVMLSLFWVHAPKWVSGLACVAVGWLAIPYLPEFRASLSPESIVLILLGGVFYTVGAVVYAVKRPNPWPRVFGYHEIFHLLVVFAAALHFVVIGQLVK
jgi:hemolysin III